MKCLDIEKLESLRIRAQISIVDICKLLEVSRPTYYTWIKNGGAAQSPANIRFANFWMRQIEKALRDHKLPCDEGCLDIIRTVAGVRGE